MTFTHFLNQKLIIPQSGIKLQLSKRVNRLNDPFEEKLHLEIKQCCELRLSVLGQDLPQTKKIGFVLGLAGLVLCCETRSCHARHHNDLEGHNNFSSNIYSLSIMYSWNLSIICAWNITTVKINSGIYLLKS